MNELDIEFAGLNKTLDKNTGEYSYGLTYTEFIAPLIKTVQTQQKEIDELKYKYNELNHILLKKYKSYLDWSVISNVTEFTLSIENLTEFKDLIDWSIINKRNDLKYTNILLDKFSDYINWSEASKAISIEFSVDFVKKHIDRWDWLTLFNNPLIIEDLDKYESAFKDKLNAVRFIERFPDSNPKVYHFAHLFNAVNIIKSRKF